MTRVNANIFHQVLLLGSLIVLPSVVLGDAGHDAKKEPAAMEGMDHGKMKMGGQGGATATSGRWMAPAEAARRGNPVRADEVSRASGRKLFEANCASCHGPTGRGNGHLAARLETLLADLVVMARQHPDGDFAWKIANGRGQMPAWKETLTENQIWDLVNFIQYLGDADKLEHAHPSGHRH